MNVLSLFDGMSCGMIALNRAGVKVNKYYAAEVDKDAISISKKNYPKIIQIGDVKEVHPIALNSFLHLLIGGSPCQGFSFAGKQLNFNDPRSALFFEYVRILNEIREYNPNVKFLLENVVMKKEHQDIISGYLGVQPIKIDSALHSACHRRRLYWTNISQNEIPNKNVIVSDIITELNAPEKYTVSGKWAEYFDRQLAIRIKKSLIQVDKDKAICLTARMYANWSGNFVRIGDKIRRYTPIECERIMGIPDNYSECVSDVKRYRAIGNAWQVDTITYLFNNL